MSMGASRAPARTAGGLSRCANTTRPGRTSAGRRKPRLEALAEEGCAQAVAERVLRAGLVAGGAGRGGGVAVGVALVAGPVLDHQRLLAFPAADLFAAAAALQQAVVAVD